MLGSGSLAALLAAPLHWTSTPQRPDSSRAARRRRTLRPCSARVDAAAPGATLVVGARGVSRRPGASIGRSPSTAAAGRAWSAPARAASSASRAAGRHDRRASTSTASRRRRPRPRFRRDPRLCAPHRRSATAAIVNALFGIYLREAPGVVVEGCRLAGHPRKGARREGLGHPRLEHRRLPPGGERDRGRARRLLHPVVVPRRDPGNVARDLRYGLHYMFSDDNVFEDNLFENGAAGSRAHVLEAHRRSAATASSTTAASRRWACCSRPATTWSPRTT